MWTEITRPDYERTGRRQAFFRVVAAECLIGWNSYSTRKIQMSQVYMTSTLNVNFSDRSSSFKLSLKLKIIFSNIDGSDHINKSALSCSTFNEIFFNLIPAQACESESATLTPCLTAGRI